MVVLAPDTTATKNYNLSCGGGACGHHRGPTKKTLLRLFMAVVVKRGEKGRKGRYAAHLWRQGKERNLAFVGGGAASAHQGARDSKSTQ